MSPQGGYAAQPGYATAQRPGILPLRPQSLADILEGSFAALRQNPGAVLGTILLVALIQTLLISLPLIWMISGWATNNFIVDSGSSDAEVIFAEAFGSFLIFMGIAALGGVIGTALTLVAQGVLSVVVARGAVGLKTSLGQAWRLTGKSIGSLLGLVGLVLIAWAVAALLSVLIMLAGWALSGSSEAGSWVAAPIMLLLMFGMIPLTLWLYVKLSLAPSAIAIEQLGPWQGVKRSWALTRGVWWRTFGIVLLVGIIVGIITSLISGGLTAVLGLFFPNESGATTADAAFGLLTVVGTVTSIIGALVSAIGTAYLALVVAMLYIDYRIRQESFDLDLAASAAQVGSTDQDARFSTVRGTGPNTSTDTMVPGRSTPHALGTPPR